MIKKAEEMVKEIREQMRDGKGYAEVTHIYKPDELYSKHARLIARVMLNPGCSIGLHPHDTDEEIFYITKGTGLFNDNGVKKKIYAGDAAVTGGGAKHSIENIGEETLEFLAIILYI